MLSNSKRQSRQRQSQNSLDDGSSAPAQRVVVEGHAVDAAVNTRLSLDPSATANLLTLAEAKLATRTVHGDDLP